ncbi:MAG: hypothetical protein IIB60_03075 [Planctomycetes bacterium]|nr:hypothetical protein [Planctomycetota bacterium]
MSADSWKQEASQGEINVLLDWSITVRNQAGYDMTGVLDDIYGYIRDRALNDPAWLDENGTVWMKKMVLRIEDKVTPEQRKQVLENVVGLVVEDRDRFLGLDVGDMGRLQEMTEPYGVSKAAWDGWVLDWFTNSDT